MYMTRTAFYVAGVVVIGLVALFLWDRAFDGSSQVVSEDIEIAASTDTLIPAPADGDQITETVQPTDTALEMDRTDDASGNVGDGSTSACGVRVRASGLVFVPNRCALLTTIPGESCGPGNVSCRPVYSVVLADGAVGHAREIGFTGFNKIENGIYPIGDTVKGHLITEKPASYHAIGGQIIITAFTPGGTSAEVNFTVDFANGTHIEGSGTLKLETEYAS